MLIYIFPAAATAGAQREESGAYSYRECSPATERERERAPCVCECGERERERGQRVAKKSIQMAVLVFAQQQHTSGSKLDSVGSKLYRGSTQRSQESKITGCTRVVEHDE